MHKERLKQKQQAHLMQRSSCRLQSSHINIVYSPFAVLLHGYVVHPLVLLHFHYLKMTPLAQLARGCQEETQEKRMVKAVTKHAVIHKKTATE